MLCQAFVLLAVIALPAGLRAGSPLYNVSNFPPDFQVLAVNASGQAVGFAGSPNFSGTRAALVSNGQLTFLGTLPGGDHSEATGINASGQIVGDSNRGGDGAFHAFLYENGQMMDLGTLPGGATSYATGINDAGMVVGWSDTLQPGFSYPRPDHAFIYSGGQMTDLGNLSASNNFGNFSAALAINNSGVVVGWGITDNFETHAFRYAGTMSDLGTLGGSESRARAINSAGDIVGFSATPSDFAYHAFLVPAGGSMMDLGTIAGYNNSSAYGINDAGVIVGTGSAQAPPFVYSPGTGMQDLRELVDNREFHLTAAVAINRVGQIAAQGSNTEFTAGAFLLTPPGASRSPLWATSPPACAWSRGTTCLSAVLS